MNLFDFDKTIYKYDSTVRFWLYCMKIKPYIALGLPMQVFYTILYKLRLVSKEKYKSRFFFFVRYFKDIDLTVKNFWQKEKSNICEWFFKVKKPGDYVVSASPEFLLNEIRFLSHQPHFSSRTITMRPHDRTKCSPLKPTSV